MASFQIWLIARENVDSGAYNALFTQEIEKLLPRLTHQRQHVESLRNFNFVGYISACLRSAGFVGREVEERTHDIVVRLLLLPGGLFQNYSEDRHGPFIARFKTAVTNAVRSMAERESNRRRHLQIIARSAPVRHQPAEQDDKLIGGFRELVRQRLGNLGLQVLDARLAGEEIKGLVGSSQLGRPTAYSLKKIVSQIKKLALEYGQSLGDPDFLRGLEQAMEKEKTTVQQRKATTKQRNVATGESVLIGPTSRSSVRWSR